MESKPQIEIFAFNWDTLTYGGPQGHGIESAMPVFDYIRDHGRKVAILGSTDTESLVRAILHYNLPPHNLVRRIDFLAGSEDESSRLAIAYDHFNLRPESMLYLADSPESVWAAKNRGVQSAAVLNGRANGTLKAVKPDYVINRLSEAMSLCNDKKAVAASTV